jgi:hypothetical protein
VGWVRSPNHRKVHVLHVLSPPAPGLGRLNGVIRLNHLLAQALSPTPAGQTVQHQLEKYGGATVVEVEDALNDAAQQDLIGVEHRLVRVDAPPWLHLNPVLTPVIAPKPTFEPLD